MDIIYFSVFNQFTESEKTIHEAIETYKTINKEKISIASELTSYINNPMKLSAKIDRINKLSIEENKFLSWIKTKSVGSQNINSNPTLTATNDDESSSSSESSTDYQNIQTRNYNRSNRYNRTIQNNKEINNNISRHVNQKKPRKDPPLLPNPCTPTSSTDEKHNCNNDNNATPPPTNTFPMQTVSTNVSNRKPPPSHVFNLVMRISEILMQFYPLPVHPDVINLELQNKFNYGSMVNHLRNGFEYDFISLNRNGFYYVYPDLLEKRLSATKRQRIMKNKLSVLMNGIHNNGIKSTNQNVHLLFKYYIGWIPTKFDFTFMYKLLNKRKRNIKYYRNVKPLEDILSYQQILICSLQCIDHRGCSGEQLRSEILNRFGISIDLSNPYIKNRLNEICDLHVRRTKGYYKLGFETKKKQRDLLEWFNTNFLNVKYNKYIQSIKSNNGNNNNMFESNYRYKPKQSRADRQ